MNKFNKAIYFVAVSLLLAACGGGGGGSDGLINGTTIQAGDMIVKADGAVEPKLADKIEFTGAQWSIVNIERKLVNDQTIAWFIEVRK